MAAVEYILGFGVALFTVVFALFQCIRCRENDRKQSENTNNNEPQDKTHSCGPSEAGCEEAGKHNVRKLPDIPHNTTTGDGEVVENVDETVGSSEVYATVNDYPVRADLNEGRSIYAVNGPNHRGVSKHPYAILTGRHSSSEEEENTDNDTYAVPHPQLYSKQTSSPKVWDGSTYEASPPVPEKRYEAGEPSTSDFNSQPSISAASAVAGRASAADIPLMTPMIQDNESEYNNSQASNGYSLISVREPLDRLIGDTQNSYTEVQEVESHYDIVPDDPDKMYTEITAQNYHSTENYSTIDLDMVYGNGIHPPAPPTVESLRSVAQAHSRQASLSSFVSDTEGAGASLPVNSKIEDMYSKIDKKKKSRSTIHVMVTGGSAAASSMSESDCGEMYAQIQKPRRKSASQPGVVSRYSFTTHSHHHHHHPPPPETARKSDGISVVRRSSSKEDPGYEKIREYPRNSPVELSVESDNDYEVVAESRFRDYETLRSRQHRNSKDVDDDDKIEADPGYEKVHPNRDDAGGSDAGYEIVGEPSYFQRSDPNYESLKYATTTGGRSEPNYWHIQSKQSSETEDPLYEKINGDELGLKRADSDEGYETVSNIRTSSNTSNSSSNNNNNNSNGKVLSNASNTAYQSGSSDSASKNADEHLRTNDGGGSSVFDDSDSLL